MARARNLKPGFFKNEQLADLGPEGMCLFAGLWTLADRAGRLEDRPRRIKAEVFPYFEVDVDAGLAALQERGFVVRYQVDGERYLQITNFEKHQAPHYKEALSVIPAPPVWADSPVVATGPSADLRASILARDGRCVECGAVEDLTLDHIIPRSLGGTDDEENLQTLCRRCNSAKNNRQASSILKEVSANDRPMIGQPSVKKGGPLASDSLNRTPSSLTPDSGLLDSAPARETGADAPPKPKLKRAEAIGHWEPSGDEREWAYNEGFSEAEFNAQLLLFHDHYQGTGKPMKDWPATFRNWMRRSREWARAPNGRTEDASDRRPAIKPYDPGPRKSLSPEKRAELASQLGREL